MNQNANGATDREELGLGGTFRRRATHLRAQAFTVLGMVVLNLGAAIWIFFSAAEITKQDVAVEEVLRRSADIEVLIANQEDEIPTKPELPKPEFHPTEVEENTYEVIIDNISIKFAKFNSILSSTNDIVVNKISEGTISIDRGDFNLKRVLQFEEIYVDETLSEGDGYFIPTFSRKTGVFSYETDNLIAFGEAISVSLYIRDMLQELFNEMEQLNMTAIDLRKQIRESFETELKKWKDDTQKAQTKWEEDTNEQRRELSELYSGLDLVRQNEFKQRFGVGITSREELKISVPFLIQTNITRFGPMIIILFFVSILVSLYRYSIRLAAFYDARADALELIGLKIDPEPFEKYVASLSPDAHDLGKPPKLPIEHAVDLAKAAVTKATPG